MSSSEAFGVAGQVTDHLTRLDAVIDELQGDELSTLPDADVLDTLRRLETALRKAATLGHRAIVQLSERGLPAKNGCKSLNQLLIQVLRVSGGDASERIKSAKACGTWHTVTGQPLPPTLPATAAAQADGEAGPDHAKAVREVIAKIPHKVSSNEVAKAESILGELARSATPEDVSAVGQDLLATLNPDGNLTDDKHRAAHRGVSVGRQDADLMSPIRGNLDPATRALLDPILAKWARPGMNNPNDPDSPRGDAEHPNLNREQLVAAAARDTRSAAQRNHDAFTAMFRTLLEGGALGSHRGLPVTTILMMGIDQLEAETGLVTTASGGLLPIRDALALAEQSHPVLVLFDHHGRPLHLGRDKRLASADQRLALIAADKGCTRPGCSQPATMTAVHHVMDWRKGGQTNIDQLAPACDACHALVHDGPGGWKTRIAPADSEYPGRTEWIPPPHIDPEQRPRVNHRHHPRELLSQARRRADARRTGGAGRKGAASKQSRQSTRKESARDDTDVP